MAGSPMMRFCLLSLFTLLLLDAGSGQFNSFLQLLQLPGHDGVSRVCHLTADNFTSISGAQGTLVVVFQSRNSSNLRDFVEVTAQLLERRSVAVCTAEPGIQHASGVPQVGDIHIYHNGRFHPYFGRRTVPALLTFILKVDTHHIHTINGKVDKVAFDALQQPRVIGFFMQSTADYAAFEEAAMVLSPSVPFYVVFDRAVAKHMKLPTIGQVNLVKPLEKTPVPCPINPASAADIIAFVDANKGVVLTKLTEHNLYDPTILDPSKQLMLAIAEQTSPMGGYFHRLLTKIIKTNANISEFQKLNIVWLEPSVFPTVIVMMDQLETLYGIPSQLPAFGMINMTSNESAWFNISSLNTTSDKTTDQNNINILQDWIISVWNRTAQLHNMGLQHFARMPQSQVVPEGSSFVLECKVEQKVGDCLWLRDGQNIGFNLARHAHYAWQGDHTSGDCSLQVSAAKRGRHDGTWVCEVTGDETNPTLTSLPAMVTIQDPAEKKAEL